MKKSVPHISIKLDRALESAYQSNKASAKRRLSNDIAMDYIQSIYESYPIKNYDKDLKIDLMPDSAKDKQHEVYQNLCYFNAL